MYHWHMTAEKLSRIYKGTSNLHLKCGKHKADMSNSRPAGWIRPAMGPGPACRFAPEMARDWLLLPQLQPTPAWPGAPLAAHTEAVSVWGLVVLSSSCTSCPLAGHELVYPRVAQHA